MAGPARPTCRISDTRPDWYRTARFAIRPPERTRGGQAFVKLTRNSSVPVSAIETMKPPMLGAVIE